MYVLPLVLTFDAGVRPRKAWNRVGRQKWRWVTAFLSAPAGSLVLNSIVPGVLVVPISAYYMVRVRSLLAVASGLVAVEDGRPNLALDEQAGAALLFGLPVLAFLGIVLWTGDARGRLVALALAVPPLVVIGVIVARSTRR